MPSAGAKTSKPAATTKPGYLYLTWVKREHDVLVAVVGPNADRFEYGWVRRLGPRNYKALISVRGERVFAIGTKTRDAMRALEREIDRRSIGLFGADVVVFETDAERDVRHAADRDAPSTCTDRTTPDTCAEQGCVEEPAAVGRFVAAGDKSAGQIAYEADCAVQPTYHDGQPRKAWSQLCYATRDTWERDPTTKPRAANIAAHAAAVPAMVPQQVQQWQADAGAAIARPAYTPGPWEIGSDDSMEGYPFIPISAGVCGTATWEEVAQVQPGMDVSGDFVITEENRATARLIAAGPDLIRAGKHLAVKLAEAYRSAGVNPAECQAIRDWMSVVAQTEKAAA